MKASLALVAVVIAGAVAVYVLMVQDRAAKPTVVSSAERTRRALFQEIQPVRLKNCELQRLGEANDGGYLMCGNLLGGVRAGYSYGISGYDGWGCEISRRLRVPVHQYDCFDVRQPVCVGGETHFHAECIGPEYKVEGGRSFDALTQQLRRNGDDGKDVVVKMDVERAEWDSLLATPTAVLDRFAQLAIEFHGTDEVRFLATMQKLKEVFVVAHLHFNNHSCIGGAAPFPAEAYEVLLVNKRLAEPDDAGPVPRPHTLDAPNNPELRDCQSPLAYLPAGTLRNASPLSLALVR